MNIVKGMQLSSYAESLSTNMKARYLEKIKIINDINPLALNFSTKSCQKFYQL